MRLTTRTLVTGGLIGLMGLTYWSSPSPVRAASPTTQPKEIGGEPNNPGTAQQREAEIPALRNARKQLEEIDAMLGKDVNDPKQHRAKARQALHTAIDEINSEIMEYEGKTK